MTDQQSSRKLKKPNRAWIAPLQVGAGARYVQIIQQVSSGIADGVLQPGDRLPPQRELAQEMGVDLTTVTRAYTELRQSGLIEAQGAGGSYVSNVGARTRTTVDLSMNIPPLLSSPGMIELFQTASGPLRAALPAGEILTYHVGAGTREDREAGAAWLAPALGSVDPDRVVICPGAQTAITAILLARTQPGDVILADAMTYPGILASARVLQRTVIAVPGDAGGMLPEALNELCEQHTPTLIYLNPTIQNPTTVTMPADRRESVHRIAATRGIAILEDDPYWLLAGDAPPPLASIAGGAVYYVSTLSKCFAPGLRTAYLVVPQTEPIGPVLDALRAISLMSSQCMVSIATSAINSRKAHEHLTRVRAELKERQRIARRVLSTPFSAHEHGLHLWLDLPRGLDRYRLIQTAQEHGLGVTGADAFSIDDGPTEAIRISLGGAPNQQALAQALETLGNLLVVRPLPGIAAVV